MRVRSFRAPKMAEAMAALRAELGDEAIILGTRRSGGGVEITAALEPEEPVIIPPAAVAPAITGPLCFHNAPAPLAERLQGRPLDAALGEVFTFAPLPAGRTRPLLLAGPPGAGKTLTCAKLAVRHVMGGTTPLVVTTDGKRAGAA